MILINIVDLYSLVVFLAVILSWVQLPHDNPVAQFVNSLTEPVLGPIRRALPPMGGMDFSPMILLVGLQMLKAFLIGSLR
jgi:YggT family protein